MASHDLLPCPFCGVRPSYDAGAHSVRHEFGDEPCPLDDLVFPFDEWNARAAETELREALKFIAGHDAGANGLTGFAAELVDMLTNHARAALSNTGGGG